jgi:hypothetical protein
VNSLFFVGSALFLAVAFAPIQPQDDPATDPYNSCVTAIKNDPQNAYDPCQRYLDALPSGDSKHDDAKHIQYAKRWIATFEKLRPYVQFLQELTTDQNAPWFVYQPDKDIDLPQTSQEEGPYKVEISRSVSSPTEEDLLKTAEAVYSSPSKMIEDVFRFPDNWANEPPQEMAPIWGMRGNDNIQSANVVTARAVRYYYDLTLAVRQNPHLPSGFSAANTDLKYTASIKHFDHYSHNKDSFENVYVADLTLEWGFVCGGLCGMGFTRNKLVVLNRNGEVVAMYLDAPGNSQNWVS